jgi:glycosyltransferase involved in cell wall biosynthesis
VEKKLNVCIISREFLPDTAFGGIGTFSHDTALLLKERGHRVTVLSQSLGETHTFDHHGIAVHKLKVPPPFGSYRFLPALILGFNFVVLRRLLHLHRVQPFDIVDVPDHLAEGLFAGLFTGLPVVTRLHTPFALLVHLGLNNYRKGLAYALIRLAEKIALSRSTVLYAPCMDLVERCVKLFSLRPISTRIFSYPLDLSLFSPAPREHGDGPVRLLFLGRLEQRKGIETIVAALPRVLARYPDVSLTLVGRDTPNINGYRSARQYMQEAFARHGCLDRVRFHDYVALDQLPAFFHAHDIVWVPSLYDNYPIICLEAMACGVAVVVADSGGLPEMVKDRQTGLVFQTGNAAALAECTLELCASAELRSSVAKRARDSVVAECSADTIYARTVELYRFALGES